MNERVCGHDRRQRLRAAMCRALSKTNIGAILLNAMGTINAACGSVR
jgi:hypothetical protein